MQSPLNIVASPPLPRLTLVLGAARSGKSAFAERLLAGHAGTRIYLATAQAGDAEMAARIAEHRRRRGPGWRTVEEPLDLPGALRGQTRHDTAVLVDCLTLWLGNLMAAGRDVPVSAQGLLDILPLLAGSVVFVGNEVGAGIVPDNAMARAFRDHAGRLHQDLAAVAGRVYLVTAGLALTLKDDCPT